jgi:hypothetical protein
MTAPDRKTAPVPVLLVTGPVGVGKTVVTGEAATLLSEAGIPHALADLTVIGACWPPRADDRWNEELIHANLACMWRNFRRAGARRMLLCRVLEARGLLGRVTEAVPGADITVLSPVLFAGIVGSTGRGRRPGRLKEPPAAGRSSIGHHRPV